MEGRTIARPNPSGGTHDCTCWLDPTFNGGPDNCPAEPFATPGERVTAGWAPFNGGPDNCPAERFCLMLEANQELLLQWRAGQLPGRTNNAMERALEVLTPSMEGRTIARPNLSRNQLATVR